MNKYQIASVIGEVDDELITESGKNTVKRRSLLRWMAAAAALLIAVGAALTTAKALQKAEVPEVTAQYAFMSDTKVPKDAVLPPSQSHGDISEARYLRSYDISQMYDAAEAVCIVTIRDWIGEDRVHTYFEAKVERTYKGELPETVLISQTGNSEYQMDGSPLFTYGDKLLVGLIPRRNSTYPGAYEIVGTDIAMLYAAMAEDGEVYLLDHQGMLSYETERNMDRAFTDHSSDEALVNELLKYIGKYDKAICDEIQCHYTFDPDAEEFKLPYSIYSLDEIEAFMAEKGNK